MGAEVAGYGMKGGGLWEGKGAGYGKSGAKVAVYGMATGAVVYEGGGIWQPRGSRLWGKGGRLWEGKSPFFPAKVAVYGMRGIRRKKQHERRCEAVNGSRAEGKVPVYGNATREQVGERKRGETASSSGFLRKLAAMVDVYGTAGRRAGETVPRTALADGFRQQLPFKGSRLWEM